MPAERGDSFETVFVEGRFRDRGRPCGWNSNVSVSLWSLGCAHSKIARDRSSTQLYNRLKITTHLTDIVVSCPDKNNKCMLNFTLSTLPQHIFQLAEKKRFLHFLMGG